MNSNVLWKIPDPMTLCCMVLDWMMFMLYILIISLLCIFHVDAFLNGAWLWHGRLHHASIYTIHKLVRHDLEKGLPPYKFEKDYVCSVCVRGKQVCELFKPLKSDVYLKMLRIVAHVPL